MLTIDYPDTPASDAIKALLDTLHRLAPQKLPTDQGIYAEPLDEHIVRATPQDFFKAGFNFDDQKYLDNPVNGHMHGERISLEVQFSPHHKHQALTYESSQNVGISAEGTPILWLDGRPIAVPRGDDGGTLLRHGWGHWADDRFFATRVGGLHDHPLIYYGFATPRLGALFGLLICDAERHTQRLVLPADDQRWTIPILARRGDRLVIYANGDDHDADRVGWTSEPLD